MAILKQEFPGDIMVEFEAKTLLPSTHDDDVWLTDGYGDYVRNYLRAMAAMPELAPSKVTRNPV